jgi:hypothetical protein
MIRENFSAGSTAVSVILIVFSCVGIAAVLFTDDKTSLCMLAYFRDFLRVEELT